MGERGRVRVGARVREGCGRLRGDARLVHAAGGSFALDRVFWPGESEPQYRLFSELARPLLLRAVEGYNACLFAYGQTGTGKTYSMMGPTGNFQGSEAGIIPRFCQELFKIIDRSEFKYEIDASYYEIYNEKIYDLLGQEKTTKTPLRVREHPVTGPYVENLSLRRIVSFEDAGKLLALGNGRLATAATFHNDRSSRSHSIFELTIGSYKDQAMVRSKVSLVDLAGSERVALKQISTDRYKEGLSINKSLLTLGKVITALSDEKGNNFIPYRESVLTWLLKENLGHNSYTTMLATVSSDDEMAEETMATLRYACRARQIINTVQINEDPQHKMIRELRSEIEKLRSLKDVIINGNNSSNLNEKFDEIERMYPSIERSDENLLENQKSMISKLQEKLEQLTDNLEAAEKRRDELEWQKNKQIENVKSGDVSYYSSDFLENLQNILDDSANSADQLCDIPNESFVLVRDIKKSLDLLQNICSSHLENKLYAKHIMPLIANMKNDSVKLKNILKSHSSANT